jgi:hypothetical protein
MKVGISEAVNTVLAIWMAEAAGLYEAQSIKVEIINMNGGSRGAAELAAGRIDAMHVGLSSVIRLNKTGGDLRVVAALANVIRFAFLAAPGVKTAADLKGGVVGVSSFGSESDATVTLALQTARADARRRHIEGIRRRPEAAGGGAVGRDQGDRGQRADHQHGARTGRHRAGRSGAGADSMVVHRHRGQAQRDRGPARGADPLHQGHGEGNRLALTDEARAKAVLAEKANIRDPKILQISYNDFKALSPPDLAPTRAAAENILRQFPDASRNLADYIDTSILDSLGK